MMYSRRGLLVISKAAVLGQSTEQLERDAVFGQDGTKAWQEAACFQLLPPQNTEPDNELIVSLRTLRYHHHLWVLAALRDRTAMR